MDLAAEEVLLPGGAPYVDDEASPILFLGDSYAKVYHFGACRHAGITAHIAREIGMPLDLVLGEGMGPEIRGKLIRRGPGALAGKKLVIWAMSERDLYGFRSAWEITPLP